MWDDDFFSIHFDSFGITLNSTPFYVSLSWVSIIVTTVLVVGLKTLRRRKRNK